MGWLSDLFGGSNPAIDTWEERLDDFVAQSSQANHDLTQRLVDQTESLLEMIGEDTGTGHFGNIVDILESSSDDEFGYSGWWPKGDVESV
ncbi:MAG: hypothetical protein HC874_31550 [Richelia sp. SL_2_1]|nr:hypothetical protein [Richelia sp. SL_2_1]